jgi:hypothetical protein
VDVALGGGHHQRAAQGDLARAETTNLTSVVLVVSLLVALVLGGADIAFSWLIEQTLLR